MQKPQLLHTLIRHTDRIEALAFSPDGHMLASSAADKTIRLWDVNSGVKLFSLTGHEMDVRSLAFSPDGSLLASCAETVRLWDTTGGQLLHTFDVDAVKKSASSHRLNDLESQPPAIFSPDGSLLAATTPRPAQVKLWDAASRKFHAMLSAETADHYDKDHLISLSFSPDGRLLAGGSRMTLNYGTFVGVWNIIDGSLLPHFIRPLEGGSLAGGSIVYFIDDTRLLISSPAADNKFKNEIYNLTTGICEHTTRFPMSVSALFNPKDNMLITGSQEGDITFWNLMSGEKLYAFPAHSHRVTALALSPGRQLLASGSSGHRIKLWQLA